MSKILYIVDNDKKNSYKYNIKEDTIIYHFSIDSSSDVEIELSVPDVQLYYYYNNINYKDNYFNIRIFDIYIADLSKNSSFYIFYFYIFKCR